MMTAWIACAAYVAGHLVGYAVGLRRGRKLGAAEGARFGARYVITNMRRLGLAIDDSHAIEDLTARAGELLRDPDAPKGPPNAS